MNPCPTVFGWWRILCSAAQVDVRCVSTARFTGAYSIFAMSWGTVELEPEVRDWLEGLPTRQFATTAFYVDLLAEQGPLLGEPYTRQLDGKLRKLRFHLDRRSVRVTYWIASDRRIVLLTVFVKARMREEREIERARRAMARCIVEAHGVEDSHGGA